MFCPRQAGAAGTRGRRGWHSAHLLGKQQVEKKHVPVYSLWSGAGCWQTLGWAGGASPRRADHRSVRSTVDADPLTSLPTHKLPALGFSENPGHLCSGPWLQGPEAAAYWWSWDLFSIHSPGVSIQIPKQATLDHRKGYILGIRNLILCASQCLCVRWEF